MHGRGLSRLGTEVPLPLRLIARKTLSSSFGGIVLGESLKYDVKDYIADVNLAVLPNGIPDSLGDRCIERKQTGEDGKVNILFLSNLIPSKGPMTFLQIAKTVIEQEKNVHFIMAGPSDSAIFTDTLKSYIRQNNLEDFVSMPGGAYGEMKNKLFQEADIFVFPSSKEAFPVVNLEAMQWGLPVISTFVGAIPDAIIDRVNGYLADPQDSAVMASSVLKLIRDPELRRAMGRKGRERFEQEYSLDAFERKVKETMNFFMALQEQNRAGVK
jgi:glycosyltransferase involved in cell wall biosynthesis